MKLTRDKLTLSSGREYYVNAGIIGLGLDLRVSYGYDGGLPAWTHEDWYGEPTMTKEDRIELAEYMIAAWRKFAEADGPVEE